MNKIDNMTFDEAIYAMRHGRGVRRKSGWMTEKYTIDDETIERQVFFTIENGKLMMYEKLHFGENRWVKNESFMWSKDICSNDWCIVDIDWK